MSIEDLEKRVYKLERATGLVIQKRGPARAPKKAKESEEEEKE